MNKCEEGFTLIEMMVTLAILATLATAALPAVSRHHQQKKEQVLSQSLREIRSALDQYAQAVDEGVIDHRNKESPYPPSLNILTEGVVDKSSTTGKKIYFMRRIPRDPFCECESK